MFLNTAIDQQVDRFVAKENRDPNAQEYAELKEDLDATEPERRENMEELSEKFDDLREELNETIVRYMEEHKEAIQEYNEEAKTGNFESAREEYNEQMNDVRKIADYKEKTNK